MLNARDLQRVVAGSGLTKVEIAALYGVSRQALHYWETKGLPREGSHTSRAAEVITKAILNAMDRKILPLAAVSRDERARRIARMTHTLQNLKPAPAK